MILSTSQYAGPHRTPQLSATPAVSNSSSDNNTKSTLTSTVPQRGVLRSASRDSGWTVGLVFYIAVSGSSRKSSNSSGGSSGNLNNQDSNNNTSNDNNHNNNRHHRHNSSSGSSNS
jgi:hypothetical protein